LIDQIVLAPELQTASHQELVNKELDTNLVAQLDELELYGENEMRYSYSQLNVISIQKLKPHSTN